MDLNSFSSFFEIFTGLCFLYAGSVAFRYAINDTLLSLSDTMQQIKENFKLRHAELFVTQSEENLALTQEKATKLASDMIEFDKVSTSEQKFREFPNGFKSMFLITGLFCLSVLVLSGFEQFFECSEIAHLTLLSLDLVIFYNIFVFIKSFFQKSCSKNIRARWTLLFFFVAILSSSLYVNLSESVAQHCQAHALQPTDAKFKPHSLLMNEKFSIIVALVIAVSPFLLHFLRVSLHKQLFKRKFNKVGLKLEQQGAVVKKAEDLLTNNNNPNP